MATLQKVFFVSGDTVVPVPQQDGSVTNPFVSIPQALVAAAGSNGAHIFVAGGEYVLPNAAAYLVPANTVIQGAGIDVTVIKLAPQYQNHGYGFRAVNAQNVHFRDFTLDGQVAQQSYGPADNGQIGIGFSGVNNASVTDVCVKNFSKDCVYVAGGINVAVRNCRLENFARGGVTVVAVGGLVVENNHFQGGRALPVVIGNHGVWIEPDTVGAVISVAVRGNVFRILRAGVFLHNAPQAPGVSLEETGNLYEDCDQWGLLVNTCDRLSARLSRYENCGYSAASTSFKKGAQVFLSSPYGLAYLNSFAGCSGDDATLTIANNTCRGFQVDGNVFVGDKKRAIYAGPVFGGNSRRRFTNNRCYNGSQVAVATLPGIELAGTGPLPIDSDLIEGNFVEVGATSYSAAFKTSFVEQVPDLVVADATYTIRQQDRIIHSKPSASVARSYTLPSDPIIGRFYLIKDGKGDASPKPITVSPPSGGTIDGAASSVISTNWGSRSFYFNGTSWSVGSF